MDKFCDLIRELLRDMKIADSHVYLKGNLELPGYFRATKNWDMLVISEGRLLAALEFKSQKGPSFGNNFNNRAEEAIGTAHDLWTAYREGAFGVEAVRPWLGWVMLLESCPASLVAVKPKQPHFKVFPEFSVASYSKRYEILLQKLQRERLYDSTALLMASDGEGQKGNYIEPSANLSMFVFLTSLAAHLSVIAATDKPRL